jgi:hypothetical protein
MFGLVKEKVTRIYRNLHIEVLLGRLNQKNEMGGDVERMGRDKSA